MNRFCACIIALTALTVPARTTADPPLNITVYNGGTALVHDQRVVQLKRGLNHVAWSGISPGIDPTSALLAEHGATSTIKVLQQNFDDNVISPSTVLESYVGRDVTVVHDPQFTGDRATSETARILSTDNGIVLQYAHGIETDLRGHIVYPDISGRFFQRPTLDLDVESEKGGSQLLDLSYLTSGVQWSAVYAGTLDASGTHLDLTGLITLSNTSGTAYQDAHLQLVGGSVQVTQPQLRTIANVAARSVTGAFQPSQTSDTYSVNNPALQNVSQENYFEYHLYSLRRPVTILNNQTKQLSLLNARNVPIERSLEIRDAWPYYQSTPPQQPQEKGDQLTVGVYVSFKNRGGQLGVPLPPGIVRLYKPDEGGLSQFIGSDAVNATPKGGEVSLHLGDAFDVTARRKQTDFAFAGPNQCVTDSSYEVDFSNAKTSEQDVRFIEALPGQWAITAENIRHTKSSASTATWTVRVPAGGKSTLAYTARVQWC